MIENLGSRFFCRKNFFLSKRSIPQIKKMQKAASQGIKPPCQNGIKKVPELPIIWDLFVLQHPTWILTSFCLLALYHMQFLFAICIIYFCGLQVFTMISPPTELYGNSSSNLSTACLIFSLISCSFDIRSIGFLLKYSTYSFAPP